MGSFRVPTAGCDNIHEDRAAEALRCCCLQGDGSLEIMMDWASQADASARTLAKPEPDRQNVHITISPSHTQTASLVATNICLLRGARFACTSPCPACSAQSCPACLHRLPADRPTDRPKTNTSSASETAGELGTSPRQSQSKRSPKFDQIRL